MPYDNDAFDEVVQADPDEVAPGLRDVIERSLASTFAVQRVDIRTVLVSDGGYATIRWASDCTDTIREDRFTTQRAVTVHGLSMVGPARDGEPVVTHYVDWAGTMGQLGMTTSRPASVDS